MHNRRIARRAAGLIVVAVLSLLLSACQTEPNVNHKITVVIVDTSGTPVKGCSVGFEGDYAFPEVGRFTDAEGNAFAAAPDGTYQAVVSCSGTTDRESFTIEGADVVVRLTLED